MALVLPRFCLRKHEGNGSGVTVKANVTLTSWVWVQLSRVYARDHIPRQ
jgi:hypothetical protein